MFRVLGEARGERKEKNRSTGFSEAHAPEPYLSPPDPLSNSHSNTVRDLPDRAPAAPVFAHYREVREKQEPA